MSEAAEVERPIPNYMSQAVLATVFCFPFTGAAAIVEASRVNSHLAEGNRDAARVASRKARRWVFLSIWCGALMVFLTVVVGVFLAFALADLLERAS